MAQLRNDKAADAKGIVAEMLKRGQCVDDDYISNPESVLQELGNIGASLQKLEENNLFKMNLI